mmetsp:Transcript_18072/g.49906  ORF Transcript_18072/g.49906 Transcript_18072/m.49906 type:complete len:80 (-) Transcript_18072:146-385(-)
MHLVSCSAFYNLKATLAGKGGTATFQARLMEANGLRVASSKDFGSDGKLKAKAGPSTHAASSRPRSWPRLLSVRICRQA